jgi:Bacterial extracellular solute-binding protein, family 7
MPMKIGQSLLDELGKHSLKGLAYFENGWRVLASNKRPVATPDDVKSLKVRGTPNPYHMQLIEAMEGEKQARRRAAAQSPVAVNAAPGETRSPRRAPRPAACRRRGPSATAFV